MTVHLCEPKLYDYNGLFFEFGYSGPWPLCKDGRPKKLAGESFYRKFLEWDALPNKEEYRIGGGCQSIEGSFV